MTDQRHVFHYIGVQAKVIEELGPKVHRKFNAKEVHELRVATRRARAALWLIRRSSASTRFGKLESLLKALGRNLGKVRELDVALRDADHFRMGPSSLRNRRKSARKGLRKRTGKNQIAQIKKHFLTAEKKLIEGGALSFRHPSQVLKLKLEDHLKGSNRGTIARHQLRISLRKVRYSLEAIGRPVAPLNKLIKVLGDAHDLDRLQILLHEKSKIRGEQKVLNIEAEHLVVPALHFALKQLEYPSR
jgi:CHAD domain-containing protein